MSEAPAADHPATTAVGDEAPVVDIVAALAAPPPDRGVLQGVARLEIGGPDHVGGLSALLLRGEDGLMLASDRGWLLHARVVRDDDGGLLDLEDWRLDTLPLPSGWSRDIEGLAVSEDNLIISVEEPPHVIRFSGLVDGPERVSSYLDWGRLGLAMNRGFEALTDLPGGGWLAIAETRDGPGHPAVTRDARRFTYVAADGFAPTGADRLDERIVVVERRFSLLGGWRARLACLPVAALDVERLLMPTELARLGPEDGIDNMEGVAVRRAGPDLDVLILSDDNQSPFQQTVLLQYRWPGAASGGCRLSSHQPSEG